MLMVCVGIQKNQNVSHYCEPCQEQIQNGEHAGYLSAWLIKSTEETFELETITILFRGFPMEASNLKNTRLARERAVQASGKVHFLTSRGALVADATDYHAGSMPDLRFPYETGFTISRTHSTSALLSFYSTYTHTRISARRSLQETVEFCGF
ncbi:hypothetical protein E1301_Tti006340 [Triplophysa tibetana]|uniref:Uncharacterized protein n=1 Tax=Triplophysa tibetana TaxID=1572043 RepID=A0A5A9NQX8_9TELE|nr:hypothetical protein E1301_Tti006340 [Triplophysa tibetana]